MITLWLLSTRRVFRRLAARPGFTLMASGLLAIGLSGTIGFMVLIRTILLSPLPYEDPDSLYGFRSTNAREGIVKDGVSLADFADLHQSLTVFTTFAAYRGDFMTYQPVEGSSRQWLGAQVTADFFPMLGVTPLHGRLLNADDFLPGAPVVMVLSEQTWVTEFGSDLGILGTTLEINSEPIEVVGILPREARDPAFAGAWFPFPRSNPEYFVRDSRHWAATGRIAPGITQAAAQAQVDTQVAALARAYPNTNKNWEMQIVPLLEMRVSGIRRTLVIGISTACLLLFVTALNLANLLLARRLNRQGEIALERVLGASPIQMVGEILFEAAILALTGAMLAAGFLFYAFNIFLPGVEADIIPRVNEISFGLSDALALLGVALATALLCGFAPSWQTSREGFVTLLNQTGGKATQSRSTKRLRAGLLILQIGITLPIVVSATVVTEQLMSLENEPLGFKTEGVEVFILSPDQKLYPNFMDLRGFYQRITDHIREKPEFESAEVLTFPPLFGASLDFAFEVQNYQDPEGRSLQASHQFVSPGIFELLEIQLLEGRAFSEQDVLGAPMTAIVNQAFVDRYFDDGLVLGRRIKAMTWISNEWREIVGVVQTTKQASLTEAPTPQIYLPMDQTPWIFGHLLVKASNPGQPISTMIEQSIKEIFPDMATLGTTLDALHDVQTLSARTLARIMGGFALAAAAMTAFGVYALLTLMVVDQQREIGLRMAIGANGNTVLRHYLLRGLKTVAWGIAGGCAIALATDQILRPTLGMEGSTSILLFLGSAGALLLIGLLASAFPAIRAARLEPVDALRLT